MTKNSWEAHATGEKPGLEGFSDVLLLYHVRDETRASLDWKNYYPQHGRIGLASLDITGHDTDKNPS
jgi:hypothetical protein